MLVATGLLLAACAAGGERARGGLAAPGGHAYVDAAIIEALDDAPGCCPTLDRLPYQPLAAHGQFAVAQLRVRPRERGEGSTFVDKIVGGSIPRNFIPAVEKGVHEAMAAGGLHGFPVVDVATAGTRRRDHLVPPATRSLSPDQILLFSHIFERRVRSTLTR